MQVNNVQSVNFNAKQRFLSPETTKNMQTLLSKMNKETVLQQGENTFKSDILTGVNIGGDGLFIDRRFLVGPSNKLIGFSELDMGKTKLLIDNMSGRVNAIRKPFYKNWSGIIKKAADLIKTAVDNFDDKNVVENRFTRIAGFTQKGLNKIQEARKNLS